MRGKLIVIEGSDGCGKETQSKLLEEALQKKGIDVIRISFPFYSSESAGPVKMYLDGKLGEKEKLTPKQITTLYAVDRLCITKQLRIEEELDSGKWIICDRYVESNMIYQAARARDGFEKRIIVGDIANFEYEDLKIPAPDIVFYLKLDRSVSKHLLKTRDDKTDIHESDDAYLEAVSATGIELAQIYGWDVIDCNDAENGIRSKESILKDILTIIDTRDDTFEVDQDKFIVK